MPIIEVVTKQKAWWNGRNWTSVVAMAKIYSQDEAQKLMNKRWRHGLIFRTANGARQKRYPTIEEHHGS